MAVGLTLVIPAWGQTDGLVVLLLTAPDYADLPAQLHLLGFPAACLSVTPAHVQLHSQLDTEASRWWQNGKESLCLFAVGTDFLCK